MAQKTSSRIFAGISIFLCAIVLIISLAGIIGSWVVGRAVTDAALQLLTSVDRTIEATHQAIGRVNAGLTQAGDEVSSLKAAAQQLSQNVNDQGLVATLLPQGREDALSAKVQRLTDEFNHYREAVVSAIDLYRALDALPFVSLPKPQGERVQRLTDLVSQVTSAVKDLNDRIVEFRANAAGAVSRVTDALGNVTDRLGKAQMELNALDAELLAAQARLARLKQILPMVLTLLMLVVTLFLAWVAYTQIVVMRGAWRKLRAPRMSAEAALPSSQASA